MNILFIVKEFPHSQVIGGPIIIYNRIKYLSRDHTVSCVAFAPHEPTGGQIDSLSMYCKELRLVPCPGPRSALERARDWVAGPVPPYFMLNYSKQMYAEMGEVARSFPYDVVISEYSMVAQYLYNNADLDGMKRVMSVHECYYLARKKVLAVQGFSRAGRQALMQLKGLKKYEFDMYADADKVLTLTPEGRDELLAVRPGLDISVVPHGVDVDGFRPTSDRPPHPPTVTFLGNFPHDPNRDAMVFFAEEAWPAVKKAVPGARFLVVGRGPTPDMLELARRDPSIEITGEVDSVMPYMLQSDVFVCPVRMGGGFRGKVLEAMAAGVPVVSTRLGAEGLPARNGENILLTDDAPGLARETVRLLEDEGLRDEVAGSARQLMVDNFSWQKGVEILEGVLEEVVARPS
ncbi:MAG: glycosyltransferase family 4 protein [Candidatus Geothermincolia bacterium]